MEPILGPIKNGSTYNRTYNRIYNRTYNRTYNRSDISTVDTPDDCLSDMVAGDQNRMNVASANIEQGLGVPILWFNMSSAQKPKY